jgi:hypothetical protein
MKRNPRITIFVAGLALLFSVYQMHRHQFCFAQFRYISDDEILVAAVQSRFLGAIQKHHFSDPEKISNAEKILIENPDCCKLLRGTNETKLLWEYYNVIDLISGEASRLVEIKMPKLSSADKEDNIWHVPISACGRREEMNRSFSRRTTN